MSGSSGATEMGDWCREVTLYTDSEDFCDPSSSYSAQLLIQRSALDVNALQYPIFKLLILQSQLWCQGAVSCFSPRLPVKMAESNPYRQSLNPLFQDLVTPRSALWVVPLKYLSFSSLFCIASCEPEGNSMRRFFPLLSARTTETDLYRWYFNAFFLWAWDPKERSASLSSPVYIFQFFILQSSSMSRSPPWVQNLLWRWRL